MPRTIDFDATRLTEHGQVNLPAPRLGKGEIPEGELGRLLAAKGDYGLTFWPQVSSRGEVGLLGKGARMDEAHAWLSNNATGPWSWHETWTNHGHHLAVVVYVERIPDRLRFVEAFAEFKADEEWESNVESIAVLRGALPARTEKDKLSIWTGRRRGFELVDDERDKTLVASFSIPEMRDAFALDWADRAERLADDKFKFPVDIQRDFYRWSYDNQAIRGPDGDGDGWRLEIRYPSVAREFERDWGDRFAKADGGVYTAASYPTCPTRKPPDDFMAYVRGEREDYATPYAEESAPGEGPEGPSPDVPGPSGP